MRSYVKVKYNECTRTESLTADCESFSWTDCASGSADTMTLTLSNITGKWFKGYYPESKDNIQTWIVVEDWPVEATVKKKVKVVKKGTKTGTAKLKTTKKATKKKNEQKVYCGKFAIDSLHFSGSPEELELSGISVPISSGFNVSQHSRTWKKTSVKRILQAIAKRYGISLQYGAADHNIDSVSQSGQTDLDFICSLCSEYDIALKIYNSKIVTYSKTAYEKKTAKHTINKGDEESYNIDSECLKKCNSVKIQYTSGKKKKTLTYQFTRPKTKGTRQLFVTTKAESIADAEKKAKAALRENIRGCISVNITLTGNIKYLAADNVNLKGFGKKLDGKYFIDEVTHERSGGKYTTQITMHPCVTDF